MAEIVYCKNEKKLLANVCIGKATQWAISLIWFSHLFFFFFFLLKLSKSDKPSCCPFLLGITNGSSFEALNGFTSLTTFVKQLHLRHLHAACRKHIKFWIATPPPFPREWKTLPLFIPQASHFYWKNPSSKGRPCFPPNRIVTVHTCTICEWTLCLQWWCCPAVCW